MFRLILVLLLMSQVHSLVQTMQYHHVRVARKSRSDAAPHETGYVYSRLNNGPGTFAAYASGDASARRRVHPVAEPLVLHRKSHRPTRSDKARKYGANPIKRYADAELNSQHLDAGGTRKSPTPEANLSGPAVDRPVAAAYTASSAVEPVLSETSYEAPASSYPYELAKAEAKHDSSSIKADLMYERLKSVMHYRPPAGAMSNRSYGTLSDFHVDDDDLRTSSRSSYDSWPYFYHSPYEYEHNKMKSGLEKAKDKRYAVDTEHKVIPVHEHYEHDKEPDTYLGPDAESSTADQPFSGHQPFFSYVLGDYVDDKNDEDSLTFKGMDWGKEFDYGQKEIGIRHPRLPHYSPVGYPDANSAQATNDHRVYGESVTERGYDKQHEFDKHEKGENLHSNDRKEYEKAGNKQQHFKQFADSFANKFGSEDQKKNARYSLKQNQDKGEKRNGFHRVYHKDEYSENNEFFDNTNQSAKAEEDGATSAHAGGSHASLQSNAVATAGDHANAYKKSGNTRRGKFKKDHSGHDNSNGSDRDFNRYRDVANQAALSNFDDYDDYHRY